MSQPALYFSEWSDLRHEYADFLKAPLKTFDKEADAMARRFIEAGLPFTEFEAVHSETVDSWDCDNAMRMRASSVRLHILSAYDRAFLEFQALAQRCRSEIMDRHKISQRISGATDAFVSSRDTLRSTGSIQPRFLEERSAELEALNKKIAAQRDEMAGFLYSVSHDLKAPLNTVQSLLSFFLEDRDASSNDFSDIEAALATTCRTGVMLDALLSFSQSLDAKPDYEVVDLDDLVGEILQDLDEELGDAEFVKDPLPNVIGSQFQLRLLFQNLISNGVKYCAAGTTPRVEIKNKGPRGLGYTAVAVVDNGIGIDPAYHKNIFGLFKRLHVYDEYPGTGIGLALCQRIVLNHEGQIHLLSAPGEGSMFTVVLPQ